MSGGREADSSPAQLDAVVSTKDGSQFETLPSLPKPVNFHCLVIIDEETLFMAGGYGDSSTYIFTKQR